MTENYEHSELNLLEASRCEDLTSNQIKDLVIIEDFERKIINLLKGQGAHLLEGARGTGKSMLLRQAELEIDSTFNIDRKIAIYINFKTSPLYEGVKVDHYDIFKIWVTIKILEALHNKLLFLTLINSEKLEDPYKELFGIESVKEIGDSLNETLNKLNQIPFSNDRGSILDDIGSDFIAKVQDITFLNRTIIDIAKKFNISNVIFLFDEAAHTFIESQQEIFFEIFKQLHGDVIICKAAVYPTITAYGRNFQIGHDAMIIPMDRFEPGISGRKINRKQFREMIDKRLSQNGPMRKKIFKHGENLDLIIDLSTGNPRAFLHILSKALQKGDLSERVVRTATNEYIDNELLNYHISLKKRLPKFEQHIEIGLEMLRGYIIKEIKNKNEKVKKSRYQSAFFTFNRDISPNLKMSLAILCYSGLLISKGTVKISGGKTGTRYMINLALMLSEGAFKKNLKLGDAIASLSLTDYREFSSDDGSLDIYLEKIRGAENKCSKCLQIIKGDANFCSNCGEPIHQKQIISQLLEESIHSVAISQKLAQRVAAKYPTVGDVLQISHDELMEIRYIKETRARVVKNAVEEFISG
jgi:hypothetical protein